MFKLAETDKIDWPVAVDVPGDGGRTSKSTFTATFEMISQEEIRQILDDNSDMLDRQLCGWKGVADADGQEMAFSDEAKKKLLGITYVRSALFRALAEINNGRAAARKN